MAAYLLNWQGGNMCAMGAIRCTRQKRAGITTGTLPRLKLIHGRGRGLTWGDRFDGDGMLHGVYFPRDRDQSDAAPRYTNRHLATPLLDLTLLLLRSPIPSIALLISPLSSLPQILSAILQAFTIALRARMGVLSVANTSVIWWGRGLGSEAEDEKAIEDDVLGAEEEGDGRLLATCESGPPLEVRVPGLETVGWDRLDDGTGETLDKRRGTWEWFKRWGLSRVQEVRPPGGRTMKHDEAADRGW